MVVRVQAQHFTHVAFGAKQVALAQRRLAQGHALIKGADQLQLTGALLGAAVVRLDD
ncbi:hypothetical protein D3C79_1111100 [compost metagenome]